MIDLSTLNRYRDSQQERYIAARQGAVVDPSLEPFGGFFRIPSKVDGLQLRVIASRWTGNILDPSDPPWHHASISRGDRCPTWEEMEQIKRLFWPPDAVCMQLHVAESNHLNLHPYCLHIWQPAVGTIPLPPPWMVA